MRLLGIALVLSACEHGEGGGVACRFMGETQFPGESFAAGDGCNVCECVDKGTRGQVECTELPCSDGGVVDASVSRCEAEAGCAGPSCFGICCGQGELCVEGTCTCGGGPSCTDGDFCVVDPIGDDVCGDRCCGSSNNPCPL